MPDLVNFSSIESGVVRASMPISNSLVQKYIIFSYFVERVDLPWSWEMEGISGMMVEITLSTCLDELAKPTRNSLRCPSINSFLMVLLSCWQFLVLCLWSQWKEHYLLLSRVSVVWIEWTWLKIFMSLFDEWHYILLWEIEGVNFLVFLCLFLPSWWVLVWSIFLVSYDSCHPVNAPFIYYLSLTPLSHQRLHLESKVCTQ